MAKYTRSTPPPLELLCLNALWSLGEGSVKQVQRVVAQSRPLAYTTIMTVLDRLVRKGTLERRKAGRAFLYVTRATRDSVRQAALRELLDGFFDGSEEQLLVYLQNSQAAAVTCPPAPAEDRVDTVLL